MPTPATLLRRIVILVFAATCACTSHVQANDFAGYWAGTWYESSPQTDSGALNFTITQSGSELTGTVNAYGTDCNDFTGLSLSGTVTDDVASIEASAYCSMNGQTYSLEYTNGTLSGNTFEGNYTVRNPGGSTNSSGTILVTRSENTITATAGPGGSISPSGAVSVSADLSGGRVVGVEVVGEAPAEGIPSGGSAQGET